jgi:DNA-binding NarL/FixJ family response regulator
MFTSQLSSKIYVMIQVGLVEDDNGIRTYLAEYLNMQPTIRCEDVFDNAEDFLAEAQNLQSLDVLLLDINLPRMQGLDAIRPIKNLLPRLEIIMLTIHSNSNYVFQALCSGATGYLLKNTSLPDIAEAIITHHSGGSAMSPTIARLVVNRLNPVVEGSSLLTARGDTLVLTGREMQVLEALSEGLSYKLIADRLKVSPNTLPVHIRNIYRKLHINSKAEAIALFHQNRR